VVRAQGDFLAGEEPSGPAARRIWYASSYDPEKDAKLALFDGDFQMGFTIKEIADVQTGALRECCAPEEVINRWVRRCRIGKISPKSLWPLRVQKNVKLNRPFPW
jgi:branched-subunit amino acid aminotransferase/4-amino-4-deoxychorismate lyase